MNVSGKPSVKTSVVVLTYRRLDALLAVLRALAPQCTASCEVLIADDGSPESDVTALRQQLPAFSCPVLHVWHPDIGFTASRARNMAAMVSLGEQLIFLDGDCVPNPEFLMMHSKLAQPGQFVNGSRVLLSERLTTQVLAGNVNLSSAGISQWLKWRLRGDANKLAHRFQWASAPLRVERAFRWKGIRSCNLAMARADFDAVNGFDETFSGWGHEDADLVLRLHHHGLTRCNGFLSTEVFHLWHPQHSRTQASINYQTVLARIQTGQVRAKHGLQEGCDMSEVVVTTLS